MKILILSEFGDTFAIGQHFHEWGHEVRLWLKSAKHKKAFDGIFPKLYNLASVVSWKPDLVVVGENGLWKEASYLRNARLPVLGGEKLLTDLEDDRAFGIRTAIEGGVKVPDTFEFDSVSPAIEFLKKADKRFICKYNGDEEYTSFMGKRNDDVIQFIKTKPPEKPFILQRFIDFDDPIETSIEVWFSDGDPLLPPNGTMEQKRFLSDDLGENVGCMSSLVWSYEEAFNNKLVQEMWSPKMLGIIKRLGISSPVDLAFLMDKKTGKKLFLEFTPRYGINAIHALLHIMKNDFGKFLYDIARRKKPEMKLSSDYAFALTLSIPPYPYDELKEEQTPDRLIEVENIKGIENMRLWLHDAYLKDGKFKTAGTTGMLGDITTSDRDPEKAAERAKDAARKLEVSTLQFRSDAGKQARHLDYFLSQGYL